MIKKFITLILVCVLSLSVFSGCNPSISLTQEESSEETYNLLTARAEKKNSVGKDAVLQNRFDRVCAKNDVSSVKQSQIAAQTRMVLEENTASVRASQISMIQEREIEEKAEAERIAEEQARIAAEEEQKAAEEAARIAAEQAEYNEQEESPSSIGSSSCEYNEQEEAERIAQQAAAAEVQRQAEEQAATEEAARIAAEQEAAEEAARAEEERKNAYNSPETSAAILEEKAQRNGMMGRLYIPSLGINVAVFDEYALKGVIEHQEIVDREDSANYRTGWCGGDYIADHAAQDFKPLQTATTGLKAYLNTGDSILEWTCYRVCYGINTSTDLITDAGESMVNGDLEGYGILMYTCMDTEGKNVIMTFWS